MRLEGRAGDDTMYANEGNDTVYGGDNNDTFYVSADLANLPNSIDGGADDGGTGDTMVLQDLIGTYDLSTLAGVSSNIETLDMSGDGVNTEITVSSADIQGMVEKQPDLELSLDIDGEALSISGRQIQLTMNSSSKTALLKGTWNTLDELLLNNEQIGQVYNRLAYVSQFS